MIRCDPTTFTKNRDRLQEGDVFQKFMSKPLNHPRLKPLLSDEHFSADGTLIEAWPRTRASVPRTAATRTARISTGRSNDTHASTTDSDSRLYRKAAGREAKLCYMGHATMENRSGLAVGPHHAT